MPHTNRDLLISARFPRSSTYNPDWIIAAGSGGANSLWLTEWLAEVPLTFQAWWEPLLRE